MTLPFTPDQFFDVFGRYNVSLWPFALGLWLATAITLPGMLRGRAPDWVFNTLLIVHWVWAALAYHAAFFSRINPAAWLFSALFLVQAGLFAWYGLVRLRLRFSSGRSLRHVLSWVFLAYAIAYPAIVWAEGHAFPRLPTFGVPCPTTLLTIGLLLAVKRPFPPVISLIPIFWAFLGGSAAFLLEVHADLMLLLGGPILLVFAIQSSRPNRAD